MAAISPVSHPNVFKLLANADHLIDGWNGAYIQPSKPEGGEEKTIIVHHHYHPRPTFWDLWYEPTPPYFFWQSRPVVVIREAAAPREEEEQKKTEERNRWIGTIASICFVVGAYFFGQSYTRMNEAYQDNLDIHPVMTGAKNEVEYAEPPINGRINAVVDAMDRILTNIYEESRIDCHSTGALVGSIGALALASFTHNPTGQLVSAVALVALSAFKAFRWGSDSVNTMLHREARQLENLIVQAKAAINPMSAASAPPEGFAHGRQEQV